MKLSSGCPVRIQMERKTHLVSRTCCCVGVLKASHGQRTPSCWCVRASLFPCVLVFSVNGAGRCSLFVVRCSLWWMVVAVWPRRRCSCSSCSSILLPLCRRRSSHRRPPHPLSCCCCCCCARSTSVPSSSKKNNKK